MMRPRIRSLRVRVTLWYLGILLVALVTSGFVVYLGLARSLHAEVDQALDVIAAQVVDVSGRGRVEIDLDKLPVGYVASLHAPNGELLASGPPGWAAPPWDASLALSGRDDRASWRSVSLLDQHWRVIARPVFVRGSLVAVAQVARSEENVEDALDQLSAVLLTMVPLALLAAGGVGLFLAGRAFDPIDRITRTAAAIGADDLTRRLPLDVAREPDEVGRLATTFNHMLERLESAFKRQRQFTADASHELRTPLALLLTQLDVTLARPRAADDYQRALSALRGDVVRLQRLVAALLTLARADADQARIEPRHVDLGELVQQVVEGMQVIAEERGVDLVADTQPGVATLGDESSLMQLIVNLVDNAITYTPAGGRVTVATAVGSGEAAAVVSVRDTGSGIAAEHLPHVFERFYRADPARSSAGTGLGLAISQSIVAAHHGQIRADSRPGAGTTVTVTLPFTSLSASDGSSAHQRAARRGA